MPSSTRRKVKKLTDKSRLDWLEKQLGNGLISDDAGHWAVSGTGMQNIGTNMHITPIGISSSFFVEAKEWRNTIREAIDAAIEEDANAN